MVNGTYSMYYGVFDESTGGGRGFDIAVAISVSLEAGTWVDRGSIGVPADHKLFFSRREFASPLLLLLLR